MSLKVNSPNVTYTDDEIVSNYDYQTTEVEQSDDGSLTVTPVSTKYTFKTQRKAPKVGLLLIGLGGNNGSTVTAGIIANKLGLTWETKEGTRNADYFGSITQASTVRIGSKNNQEVFVPLNQLVPMADPNDFVINGWDINAATLDVAMKRAAVLPITLQEQLKPHMQKFKPMKAIHRSHFIASNQDDRADNYIDSEKYSIKEQVEIIRKDIRDFKQREKVDKVIVLWTANTERFCDVRKGLNDTSDNLLKSIEKGESEISSSTLYCVASILENCSYINGSPQNTFVPGVIELARKHRVFISGDDFKSGQTKFKSVLVDFLVSAGIKPTSIVSYNHLGNNDGKNLSAPAQFRSKEISKSNVVDDMVNSNKILYPKEDDKPDHTVVIKYVPYVGDSKRALDEYTSEIFMGGKNTIVVHNTCEDSLLAAPLIIDLVILTELMERISFKTGDMKEFDQFHPILSVLSYLLKAPLVPEGTPLVNALFRQKSCIENILKALIGIPPDNNMLLEYKQFQN